MQLKATSVIAAAILIATSAVAAPAPGPMEEGEACVIPKVVPGKDTVVEMPFIDKQFCGMVMINNMYVLIDAIADKIEPGPVECTPAGMCTKKVRYLFNDHERTGAAAHTLIFKGPKEKPAKAPQAKNS